MFTSVRVKNYKSLVDLSVNLAEKKNVAKPIVLIYGENGVGKTNFASIFYTLSQTLQTMSMKEVIQQLLEERERIVLDEGLFRDVIDKLCETETMIKDCKTIGSKGNLELEFGFVINGRVGTYLLEYDDTKLVHERLDYVISKNKTNLYDITEGHIVIHEKLFLDREYQMEFERLIEKYRGRHTFLSIMLNEYLDKAEGYVNSRVHLNLCDLLYRFCAMSIRIKGGTNNNYRQVGIAVHDILNDLDAGSIRLEEEEVLNRAEKLVNEFFTSAYSDIKEAYYKRKVSEGRLLYSLALKKLIYGKVVDVDFELESTGTQHVLKILPFLLMSLEGRAVVIDELDTGIHDVLVDNILENIMESVGGQLIITTHNTMLLESDIDPKYIYAFMVDRDANKTLVPITQYEERKHPNLNYRNRYLKGMYGGVPMCRDIDFEELQHMLK